MTTFQTPIVAGIFTDEMQARRAVDMLRNAQFDRDQLGVAMRAAGNVTESLSNDFMKLGVPREQANFYENEFNAGHIVVSVRPDGRDEEARNILRSNGAYDYDPHAASSPSNESQPAGQDPAAGQQWTGQGQPVDETQTGNYGQNDYREDVNP